VSKVKDTRGRFEMEFCSGDFKKYAMANVSSRPKTKSEEISKTFNRVFFFFFGICR